MKKNEIDCLNATIGKTVKNFKPPEQMTVSEWAEKNRRLSPESSAEAGPWRNDRTPYLKEIMDAFTDPKINKLSMVAASQVGKSEVELNIIGYIIDQDPGSIVYVQPTLDDGKKFSRLRVAPMIRDSRVLKRKVSDVKTRDSGNTILQKSFPGGMLTITGSNSASALASTPARYIIGDERDRWASSAGTEGDPWALAEARQTTFYNAKSVEVSTPTIKGASNIENGFIEGTQERWCSKCPHCGEYHNIVFSSIDFKYESKKFRNKKTYIVKEISWACPGCGCTSTEQEMKSQPAKWIAENPEAYEKGHRSFWLNAFVSPWTPWKKIIAKFLAAQGDVEKLKVVYNTLFGELWEDRGELDSEDEMLARREEYKAELPEGVLCLTCGVDTQDNRLEYEVVGYGFYDESWGIEKGIITGKPDQEDVWTRLDGIIDKNWTYADGKQLRVSLTFVDSGGHYTQEVYEQCAKRINKRVFACKGGNKEGIPFTGPPSKVNIVKDNQTIGKAWLYTLGVDAGKEKIMSALKVQEAGAKYCHFPRDEDKGYDLNFFNGLLSEKMTYENGRWRWAKIPGHERNEALDCRNYANGAYRVLKPNLEDLALKLKGSIKSAPKQIKVVKKQRKPKDYYSDY